MGERLIRIYEIVSEKLGVRGRLELAGRTGITMTEAARIRDTGELIEKFKKEAGDTYKKLAKTNGG
jgi:hypothetical protein